MPWLTRIIVTFAAVTALAMLLAGWAMSGRLQHPVSDGKGDLPLWLWEAR